MSANAKGSTVPVQSAYSSLAIGESLGQRRVRAETDFGMLEIISEMDSNFTAVSITNFMLGSANLILDDAAIEGLAYEFARLVDRHRNKRVAHSQTKEG